MQDPWRAQVRSILQVGLADNYCFKDACAEEAGLGLLLSWEKPAYKISPWLASRNLTGIQFQHRYKNFVPKLSVQCDLCWIPVSFQESGILVHARQKVPMWLAPIKPLDWERTRKPTPGLLHTLLQEHLPIADFAISGSYWYEMECFPWENAS